MAQADGAAFAPWQWRAGDTVVSRFWLALDGALADSATVRTGMYTYPEIGEVPLLDVAGNPYAPAVEWEVADARRSS